jgi:hypothetical protein
MQNFGTFVNRMLDPSVGTGAVDVYAWMFAAQFIVFVIILSSWSAFSSIEVNCMNVLNVPCVNLFSFLVRGRNIAIKPVLLMEN